MPLIIEERRAGKPDGKQNCGVQCQGPAKAEKIMKAHPEMALSLARIQWRIGACSLIVVSHLLRGMNAASVQSFICLVCKHGERVYCVNEILDSVSLYSYLNMF